ncbi:hypothetical protein F2Q69_00033786 [Brassica cretica]|uniref:Uncharacterized protein n=1 Tax=Brassica cretica TaxID=69181 RepID=A0A8S9SQY1_BRACR|nr:hypothetical protein F2Q69_00033786 [Brassica cretica]
MSWIEGFPEVCAAHVALFAFFLRKETPDVPSPMFLPPLVFLLFPTRTEGYWRLERGDFIVVGVTPRVFFLIFSSLGTKNHCLDEFVDFHHVLAPVVPSQSAGWVVRHNLGFSLPECVFYYTSFA